MKFGYLHIWKRMMEPSTGRVVVAWHRKPWWTWGLWWHPRHKSQTPRWYFSRFVGRSMFVGLGKLGMLHFQWQ